MSGQPGWHPDPAHRHEFRWWDGSRWGDQVIDGGTTATDPLTGGAFADARSGTPQGAGTTGGLKGALAPRSTSATGSAATNNISARSSSGEGAASMAPAPLPEPLVPEVPVHPIDRSAGSAPPRTSGVASHPPRSGHESGWQPVSKLLGYLGFVVSIGLLVKMVIIGYYPHEIPILGGVALVAWGLLRVSELAE